QPATISGGNGNDVFHAGGGPTTVIGGTGNNKLFAGSGPATLLGGAGNDELFAGPATDVLDGGAGFNKLYRTQNSDTIVPRSGNQIFRGEVPPAPPPDPLGDPTAILTTADVNLLLARAAA